MESSKIKPMLTERQYLSIERASLERHYYIDGEMVAMAGESKHHGIVSTNLVGLLHSSLRGKPCMALTKDTKVRSGPNPKRLPGSKGLYSYPDLVVVCGEPEYLDEHEDVLLNPTVVIKVLSPSTKSFDRGEKFKRYQEWNPTLSDYMLVSPEQVQFEHFQRQMDGAWSFLRWTSLDSAVSIFSIECVLALSDIYERTEFTKKKKRRT